MRASHRLTHRDALRFVRCVLCGVLVPVCAVAATIFVSTRGSDQATGDQAHPFATVERALRAPHRTIRIRGGTYYLTSPLALGAQDSNTTIEAQPGEHVTLSGGVPLDGFQVRNGRWSVLLREVAAGQWRFQQLFVNGTRRYRPRLPASGYFQVGGEAGDPRREFVFQNGDIRPEWAQRADIEIVNYHVWMVSRMIIERIDADKRQVRCTGSTLRDFIKFSKGQRYVVENVPEALGRPGEFYLDRRTGELTYIPVPGEDPRTTQVVAPRLEYLVSLNGASNVTFRGIAFEHTNWTTPSEGYSYSQAEAILPAAIRAGNAVECTIERCTVAHTGAYAIEWSAGSRHNRVTDCELIDLGAGGIKVGEIPPGMEKSEEAAPSLDASRLAGYTVIRNNRIAHGGRIHPAATGIWIGHSPGNQVTGNRVFDFFYTGISAGWVWGFGPSLARDNLIASNHVYQVGQGVLSDVGGIYTLGVQPGTVVRGNRVHDIESYDNAGRGIYLDEGSSDILVENNLVYNTTHECFFLSYGRNNVVRNNVFAFGRNAQFGLGRLTGTNAFTFEHNIICWRQGLAVRQRWPDASYTLDHNLYWNGGQPPLLFGKRDWDKWRRDGQDRHSLIADPLFVDPVRGDFRLRRGSPAFRIGFRALKRTPD